MVFDAARPVVAARGAQLVGVDARVQRQLGDPGLEVEQRAFDPPAGAGRARDDVVREHDAFVGGEATEREAGDVLGLLAAEPQREPEVDRELEVGVEELGPGLERAEMAGEVADVEAPHDRPLDLGPALAADLVEVGVVPGVLDGAGESAVAVEEAGRVGDGAPAVGLELGVQREVHPDVLAPVAAGGVARPRAGHHEGRAGGEPVTQGVVAGDVARVGEAEVVARDDQELGVGCVPEPLGERGHRRISVGREREGSRAWLASATMRTVMRNGSRARGRGRRSSPCSPWRRARVEVPTRRRRARPRLRRPRPRHR